MMFDDLRIGDLETKALRKPARNIRATRPGFTTHHDYCHDTRSQIEILERALDEPRACARVTHRSDQDRLRCVGPQNVFGSKALAVPANVVRTDMTIRAQRIVFITGVLVKE